MASELGTVSGEQARALDVSLLIKNTLDVLFEIQPVAVLVLDAGLRIVYANRAAEGVTRVGRTELELLSFDELIAERFADQYRQVRSRLATASLPEGLILRDKQALRGHGGSEVAVEVSLSHVQLGPYEIFLASLFEQTAAVPVGDEVQFRQIFESNPHPIGISDLQSGRLLDVNSAFERVFGHPRDRALGRTASELKLWQNDSERERALQRLLTQGSLRDQTVTAVRSDGHTLQLIVSDQIVGPPDQRRVITYADDATQGHASKLALAASEQRFAKAFRASPDALAIVEGGSNRVLEVNDGFVRMFGRPREEVLGRSSLDFGLLADPQQRAGAAALLLEHGSLRDFPIVTQTPTGVKRECSLSAESLDLGERSGFILIVRDVTEQQRAERARAELERQLRQTQKLEALGTLAGGIAHDFNNILAAILAYADLIRLDAQDPAQIQAHATQLSLAGDRATHLVRQILTLSRKQPVQPRRPLAVDAPVFEALGLVRSVLPSLVELDVRIDASLPVVLGDHTLIHQVVMNLCTNAAQAMVGAAGTLSVCVDSVQVDAEMASANPALSVQRYARISVADTGVGIAAEIQKHIYEPFFTTRAPGDGTGLGLSVVHGIVREHEGAITLHSKPGEGTTFCVYLPEYEVELREAAAPGPLLTRGNGELIVLVDDEEVLCSSIAALLQRLGYNVRAYGDPRAALREFEHYRESVRLVVSDLTMPHLSGLDLARTIHTQAPDLPIVLMTGYAREHSLQSLEVVGIRQLIHKPVTATDLSESVARALRPPSPL